ncbi:MAG: putative rane protein [Labilithrix sp.]|nr:putative rane protein [Labilithrix sp.]
MRALRPLVVAIIVAAAGTAHAQTAEQPDDSSLAQALSGEAKALYDIGRSSFRAGDAAAALANFQRAYERSSDPRLLWNMAACEASLKHWARAMTLVDRYVDSGAALLSDRDREQAKRFRTAAKRFVATVALEAPPGVTVTVDGEVTGTTPLGGPLYLDAGKRRVHFTKLGYRGVVRVDNVAGEAALTWKIEPERLRIKVPAP